MSGRPVFRWFPNVALRQVDNRPSLTPPCRLNWITRRLALLRMSLGKRGQARGEQSTRDGDHADADSGSGGVRFGLGGGCDATRPPSAGVERRRSERARRGRAGLDTRAPPCAEVCRAPTRDDRRPSRVCGSRGATLSRGHGDSRRGVGVSSRGGEAPRASEAEDAPAAMRARGLKIRERASA